MLKNNENYIKNNDYDFDNGNTNNINNNNKNNNIIIYNNNKNNNNNNNNNSSSYSSNNKNIEIITIENAKEEKEGIENVTTLIVCPSILIENWVEEINLHLHENSLKVLKYYGF
jgi:SNF2 family DNA or RNA helicase